MRKIILLLLVVSWAMLSAACAAPAAAPPAPSGKISVVTTSFPLYDFARAVGGDEVELSILLKPGAEIHSFEPTPADMIKVQNAALFLYVGGESDTWVERILAAMADQKPQTLRLLDSVQAVEEELVEGMEEEAEAEEGPALDEHIWTAPANAALMAQAIATELAAADPAHAAVFQANAAAYLAELTALDAEFQALSASAARHLLVFGDRFPFRYFVEAYGFDYRAAFPGCSTDTEPSAATLAYLIDLVKEQQIPYIYYIELSNENIARAICEQTGAQRLQLQSGQQVSKADFEAGLTYLTLMRQNLETLRKGLN